MIEHEHCHEHEPCHEHDRTTDLQGKQETGKQGKLAEHEHRQMERSEISKEPQVPEFEHHFSGEH